MNYKDMEAILGSNGRFAENLPFFEFRPQQLDLAIKIWEDLQSGDQRILAFEAPTGLGKTFAVLIPAILWAIENQKKLLFLTATIPLQEQLYYKDIPQILNILDLKLKYGLLKGRGNYVCLRKAESIYTEGLLSFNDEGQISEMIRSWTEQTDFGDLSELPLQSNHPARGLLSSSQKKCIGHHCPYRKDCFVTRMLNRARGWDLTIANYHLYLAYINGGKKEFPFVPDLVICDEAHRIAEAARSVSTIKVSREDSDNLFARNNLNMLQQIINKSGGESEDLTSNFNNCREIYQKFFDSIEFNVNNGRGYSELDQDSYENYKKSIVEFNAIRKKLNPLRAYITESQVPEEREQLSIRFIAWLSEFEEYANDLSFCSEVKHYPEWAYWRENSSLFASPVKGEELIKKAFGSNETGLLAFSATLTVDRSFSFWIRETGICPDLKGVYDTPFDLEDQMEIWVADLGLNVIDRGYDDYACKVMHTLTEQNSGHTLIILSSYRLLKKAAEYFRKKDQNYKVLVQGDLPRRDLLEMFKSYDSSVLIGTVSFREGIDVPGDKLTQVIIDRIPFQHPQDPVVNARNELEGKKAFTTVTLPRAKMSLKQATGRLIRAKNDRGKVVILDGRVISRRDWMIPQSLPRVKIRKIRINNGAVAR